MALKKALDTEKKVPADAGDVIAAADTVVVFEGDIIGKPVNTDDARRILKALRGKEHFVYTGVALVRPGTARRRVFFERSSVFFKDYTDEELEAYISTDEPYDKAGGYAIQGTFGKYIDRFEGDMDNIIGLPWSRMTEEAALL